MIETKSLKSRGAKRVAFSVLLAAAGMFAVSAWAHGPGHGRGGPGFGGPGMFLGKPEHIERGVDRALRSVNPTDAQRAQIKQIAVAAAADLKAQREAARGQRDQALALFTAPVVDARAVESLRQQNLARHDQASKRITQAMLDISNVLTPEQRAQLAERAKKRAEHMKERAGKRAAPSGAPAK